jgi:hypothetical protein
VISLSDTVAIRPTFRHDLGMLRGLCCEAYAIRMPTVLTRCCRDGIERTAYYVVKALC